MTKSYLPFPAAALSQHVIAIGKTRSGKSSKLRVAIEWLLDHDKPVTILDFKGDWWGLKSDASGKKAGYPIVIFGGKHADVPLNPQAGAQLAELLSKGNLPALIDLKGWRPTDRGRFYVDFVSRTYQLQDGGERWIAIPEVHNVAPKGRILSPQVGEMLHWTSTLASEGQGMGLMLLLDSQRGQKVHNDVLAACETLIACRVIHNADRQAIKDWIDGNGDPKIGAQMLSELAGMPRTDAYVWSPEIEFGPKRITWQMFHTYDSFAPQQRNQKRLAGWADVDLEEVRGKLSTVIEEAKANDPAELRKEIARLKKELTIANGANSMVRQFPKEQLLKAEKIAWAKGAAEGHAAGRKSMMYDIKQYTKTIRASVHAALKNAIPEFEPSDGGPVTWTGKEKLPQPPPERYIPPAAPAKSNGDAPAPDVGSSGKRRMLVALAQFPIGMSRRRLALLTGLSETSGTWSTYLSALRSSGYIEVSGDHIHITETGLQAAGDFSPLPTGEQLLDYWRGKLGTSSGIRKIFDVLAEVSPEELPASEVAQRVQLSHTSGTWSTYLSKLRGLGLIEGRGSLRLSPELLQ